MWCRVVSKMLEYDKDPEVQQRSEVTGIEPIWGPMERYGLAEKGEATAKSKGVLPMEAIYTEIWQFPPAAVPDLRAQAGRELLMIQAAQTPAPAANPPPNATGTRPSAQPAPRSNGNQPQPVRTG